jgi:hypothetical protein
MNCIEDARGGRRTPEARNFASLDPAERKVYRGWALSVGAFYSIAAAGLLAMLIAGERTSTQHAAMQSPTPAPSELRSLR